MTYVTYTATALIGPWFFGLHLRVQFRTSSHLPQSHPHIPPTDSDQINFSAEIEQESILSRNSITLKSSARSHTARNRLSIPHNAHPNDCSNASPANRARLDWTTVLSSGCPVCKVAVGPQARSQKWMSAILVEFSTSRWTSYSVGDEGIAVMGLCT